MKRGVYQMSFRGLTLAEAWRFGREPFKFSLALFLKVIDFKGPKAWLPPHECETACEETELSANAREHLLPAVEKVKNLGYRNGRFSVLAKNLDEHTLEAFCYMALHEDKMRAMFVGYVASNASGTLKRTVAATGMLSTEENPDLSFVNHGNYMDGVPSTRVIRISNATVEDLDRKMAEFMRQCRSPIRSFASFDALKAHGREMDEQNFSARIARGLYQYLGEV